VPRRLNGLKAEIVRRGLSTADAAPELGVSPTTLRNILNGYAAPWPAVLARIADTYGITGDALYGVDVAAEARRLAHAARAAQGLPERVTDPATLARVARTLPPVARHAPTPDRAA
jgi:transcriptional regulator with XRE-family HTH domain